MITTRPVNLTDALYVFARVREEDRLGEMENLAASIDEADIGITLLDGEEPIGILIGERHGVMRNMGHVWAVMTENAYGHGLELVRIARAFIRKNMKPLGFDLIYTYCHDGAEHHKKWVRTLGFTKAPEGDHYDPEGQLWRGYRYVQEEA